MNPEGLLKKTDYEQGYPLVAFGDGKILRRNMEGELDVSQSGMTIKRFLQNPQELKVVAGCERSSAW